MKRCNLVLFSCFLKFLIMTFDGLFDGLLFVPDSGPMDDACSKACVYHYLGGGIGDCVTDSFVFSAPGNRGSPVICGINTGQHSKINFRSF